MGLRFQVAHTVASARNREGIDAAVSDLIRGVILALDRFDGVAASLMASLAVHLGGGNVTRAHA